MQTIGATMGAPISPFNIDTHPELENELKAVYLCQINLVVDAAIAYLDISPQLFTLTEPNVERRFGQNLPLYITEKCLKDFSGYPEIRAHQLKLEKKRLKQVLGD